MFQRKYLTGTVLVASIAAFAAQANFSTSEYGTGEFNTGTANSFIHGLESFTPISSADLSGTITELEADCTSTSFPDEIDFMDANADDTLSCAEVNTALSSTTGVSYTSTSKQQATFILTHLDGCATVDDDCLAAAATAANNFMTSSLTDAGPAALTTLAGAVAGGLSATTSNTDDDLQIFDTNHDGNISDAEIVALLNADPNITSTITQPSGDTGLYARAYLTEIAALGASATAADINVAITDGNDWAVYAPQIGNIPTIDMDGTDSSSLTSSVIPVYDGTCGTSDFSGCSTSPANVTHTITQTHTPPGGTASAASGTLFSLNTSGNITLASGVNVQDLDAGTYTLSISSSDSSSSQSYNLSSTTAKTATLKVSNENGCITNTQVSGSDFDANTDSIEGAAVRITGSFNSSDLLFIQGASVTAATVGANSIKRYTTLGVSGVTKAEYDPSTGIMRFYGTASEAAWVGLFQRVGYIFNSSGSPSDASRTLAFTLSNRVGYLHDDGTYHYYEYYEDEDVTFDNARTKAAASGKQLFGMTGYLATPTSAEEQTVLTDKVQGIGWLGACDNLGNSTVMTRCGVTANDKTGQTHGEGRWYWVTGPEKMTYFGHDDESASTTADRWAEPTGNNANGSGEHTNVYENWNGTPGTDEPNNCCSSSEHYLHVWGSAAWNDFAYDNGAIQGYLVEWGGLSSDPDVDLDQTVNYSIPAGDANFCTYAE